MEEHKYGFLDIFVILLRGISWIWLVICTPVGMMLIAQLILDPIYILVILIIFAPPVLVLYITSKTNTYELIKEKRRRFKEHKKVNKEEKRNQINKDAQDMCDKWNRSFASIAINIPNIHKDNLALARFENDEILFGTPNLIMDEFKSIEFKLPVRCITKIQVMNEEQLFKRVTATRLLAVGIFAFAIKKNQTVDRSYLLIEYTINNVKQAIIMDATKGSYSGAKRFADMVLSKLIDLGHENNLSVDTIEDNLLEVTENTDLINDINDKEKDNENVFLDIEKLYSLKEKGILTEEEFNEKKKQLLENIK